MADVVDGTLRALARAEQLLTVLDREHTADDLHAAMRGIRHEVQTGHDLLSTFGKDVTAQTPGKAASGAPETSQAAARAIRTRSGSQRHQLLWTLAEEALTDHQLQRATGISANSERPRRLELVEAGYVTAAMRANGDEPLTRKHPQSQLDCQVWRITEKGRAALRQLQAGQMVMTYGEGLRPHELATAEPGQVPEQFVPTR